jgi:hypothetical protein
MRRRSAQPQQAHLQRAARLIASRPAEDPDLLSRCGGHGGGPVVARLAADGDVPAEELSVRSQAAAIALAEDHRRRHKRGRCRPREDDHEGRTPAAGCIGPRARGRRHRPARRSEALLRGHDLRQVVEQRVLGCRCRCSGKSAIRRPTRGRDAGRQFARASAAPGSAATRSWRQRRLATSWPHSGEPTPPATAAGTSDHDAGGDDEDQRQ